jgi:hypothetical protein
MFKIPLLTGLSMLIPLLVVAQPTKKRSRTGIAQWDCLDHSTTQALNRLKQQGVDSILTCRYDYDNGHLPNAVEHVVWQQAGKSYCQTFQGCDPAPVLVLKRFSADTLFSFYQQKHIAQLPDLRVTQAHPSHGMGYAIGVYLPNHIRYYYIHEYQLKQVEEPQELLPGERPQVPISDPRIVWLDLLVQIVQKDTKKVAR